MQEKLKIAKLKEHFDKTCLESNVLLPELSKKQSTIEKCQSYVASLKNVSPLDHILNIYHKMCSESIRFEPKSVRNFPKVLGSDCKISNDKSPSLKGHETFIDLLDTPRTFEKTSFSRTYG